MENKKGSNVGFAISFVLFVSFVVFLFNILGPVGKVESDKDFLLKHLQDEIIGGASAELTMTSVKKQDGGFIKVYEGGGLIPAYSISQNDEIGLIRTENYVFEKKILELNQTYYTDTGYTQLKSDFGIPDVNDFEFSFLGGDKTLIAEAKFGEIPSTDVFAELIPVTYVSENAEIEIGYLRVVLW